MTTNHRQGPTVAGEPAADRLMRSLDYRLTHGPGAEGLERRDVAVVLHALADHTALLAALDYSPGGMWPEARSIGRWLHDTADQLTATPGSSLYLCRHGKYATEHDCDDHLDHRMTHAEPPDTAHPTARQGSEIEERKTDG